MKLEFRVYKMLNKWYFDLFDREGGEAKRGEVLMLNKFGVKSRVTAFEMIRAIQATDLTTPIIELEKK